MKTTLIENKAGDVTIHGEAGIVSLQIPSDRSILGVLANNQVFSGDEFRDDYWVYREGQRIRKWFGSDRNIALFWPPQIDRLNHIELLYRKALVRQEAHYRRLNDFMNEVLCGKDEVALYAEPTHDYHSEKKMLLKYTVRRTGTGSWSYSFNWCECSEATPDELGQRLYSFDMRSSRLIRTVREYLNLAIIKRIGKPKANKKYRVTINGRDYWYEAQDNKWGVPELRKLMYPEDVESVVV